MGSLRIDVSRVLEIAIPCESDLGFALDNDVLERSEIVQLALQKYVVGATLTAREERIALLLSDEIRDADQLFDALPTWGATPHEARYWALVSVSQLMTPYLQQRALLSYDAWEEPWTSVYDISRLLADPDPLAAIIEDERREFGADVFAINLQSYLDRERRACSSPTRWAAEV